MIKIIRALYGNRIRFLWPAFLCVFAQCVSICRARQLPPTLHNSYDGAVVGAREIGMGEAFSAFADTAYAPYWNSGGLLNIGHNTATVCIDLLRSGGSRRRIVAGEPLQGQEVVYVGFVGREGALSWRPLSNFRQTDTELYLEREIKIQQLSLSFAIPYSPRSAFGMNINFLSGFLGVSNPGFADIAAGFGWGLDWGLTYMMAPGISWGVSVSNAPAWCYWDGYRAEQLPLGVRCGAGIQLSELLRAAIDLNRRFYRKEPEDGSDHNAVISHIGMEQRMGKYFSLRLGAYGTRWGESDSMTYTAGAGFTRDAIEINIAVRARGRIDGSPVDYNDMILSCNVGF